MTTMVDTQLTPLRKVALALTYAEYQTVHFLPNEIPEQPYEQVVVTLFKDTQDNPYEIRLVFINDIVAEIFRQQELAPPLNRAMTLQFSALLPLEVRSEHMSDLSRLLVGINRFLPFGSFSVSPADGISLRYSLIQETTDVDLKIVVEVLDYMTTFIQEWLPVISGFLEGAPTLDELLEKLERIGK